MIEAARNLAGLEGAMSTEFDRKTPHPVVGLITEWQDASGDVEERDESSDLGGTMRLGAYENKLKEGSRISEIYGKTDISERHRHRYEFNNHYRDILQKNGMLLSGHSMDETLVEIVEIPGHPWFLGCQFHPEFKSRPMDPQPLFRDFIAASLKSKMAKK